MTAPTSRFTVATAADAHAALAAVEAWAERGRAAYEDAGCQDDPRYIRLTAVAALTGAAIADVNNVPTIPPAAAERKP